VGTSDRKAAFELEKSLLTIINFLDNLELRPGAKTSPQGGPMRRNLPRTAQLALGDASLPCVVRSTKPSITINSIGMKQTFTFIARPVNDILENLTPEIALQTLLFISLRRNPSHCPAKSWPELLRTLSKPKPSKIPQYHLRWLVPVQPYLTVIEAPKSSTLSQNAQTQRVAQVLTLDYCELSSQQYVLSLALRNKR
jgi:hypothetical protein